MMTSVVSNQSRGTREKTLPTTTQTTQPQKQIQATAEQIRLAQMIYDKNYADFEDKVKQLIEVTSKTQDECMVALHDCNEDVNRAINFLLESTSDTNSWETVGKKRSLGKEGVPSDIKDIREKKGGEREASRGRGSLVFTNSHHNGRTATHSYAHATANSYAHAASGVCLVLVLISSILPVLSKAPPNLAQGVPPLMANQYIMGPGGLLPAYPVTILIYFLVLHHSLSAQDYYGVTFPGPTATMPGRDGLANNPYSGESTIYSNNLTRYRTGLPYYAGMPGVPSAFQYGPTVFVPPASAKQPAMGLANPSNQYHQQHQPSYGQHAYGTAFDDLSQAHGEYSKGGYGGSAQSQAKSAGSGPGKGLSGSGTSGGVPDMGGSIYSKTQSFDKQGFHTGTPPPFNLPSALGGTGPLNPGGAPGYAPAPFLHILPPHQQPHTQLLHHHLTQDGQEASPAMAAPPTGPTEDCFPLPTSQKAACVRVCVCIAKIKNKVPIPSQ
uniref:Uncharacterized protein n=1 Tax=Mola mola TaxID=94237 RepID=A0A3Q3XGZ8_MOLML